MVTASVGARGMGRGAADRPESILVVEDEPHLRILLYEVLESAGYSVDAVPGVAEANDALRDHEPPYDIALVDVYLEDGSGVEVLEALPDTSPLTFPITMSGLADFPTIGEAYEAGTVCYLNKPFTPYALLRYLESSRPERRSFRERVLEEREAMACPWPVRLVAWIKGIPEQPLRSPVRRTIHVGAVMLGVLLASWLLAGSIYVGLDWFYKGTDDLAGFMERVEAYLARDEAREVRRLGSRR